MDFVALVDQVIALLRQRGRVTYRTLQRQFELDADALADLLGELRYAHPEALHEDEQGLMWMDAARPTPSAPARPAVSGAQAPLTYTPAYLAEQILTSRSVLGGERKQVTVLFADIKDSTELIRDLDPEAAQQLLDPTLRAIAEMPEEALHRGLAHLQAAEFLYETRLFPEQEYTFKHALTQGRSHTGADGMKTLQRRGCYARAVVAPQVPHRTGALGGHHRRPRDDAGPSGDRSQGVRSRDPAACGSPPHRAWGGGARGHRTVRWRVEWRVGKPQER